VERRGTPRYLIGREPSLNPRRARISPLVVVLTPAKKILLLPELGASPDKASNSSRESLICLMELNSPLQKDHKIVSKTKIDNFGLPTPPMIMEIREIGFLLQNTSQCLHDDDK
jgi:hypothetical protein